MLGGIAGFNKGSISGSGSDQTQVVLAGAEELKNAAALDRINQNIKDNSLAPKTTYVDWKSNTDIEKLSYHQGENVTDGCLQIKLESNGNLGGITAYNSTSGSLERCVSGKWFLNNKSEAIGVGTRRYHRYERVRKGYAVSGERGLRGPSDQNRQHQSVSRAVSSETRTIPPAVSGVWNTASIME